MSGWTTIGDSNTFQPRLCEMAVIRESWNMSNQRRRQSCSVDILDNEEPLIGVNPYRYVRMDLDGARELSKLIRGTDALMKRFNPKEPLSKRVFAAHSESDSTANIAGIEELQQKTAPDQFTFFRIPKKIGVSHASLVLKDPIYATGASQGDKPLEKANPTVPRYDGGYSGHWIGSRDKGFVNVKMTPLSRRFPFALLKLLVEELTQNVPQRLRSLDEWVHRNLAGRTDRLRKIENRFALGISKRDKMLLRRFIFT
jgi:hypothetical protein